MNAVVLAGGFGSRLQPLTEAIPKPMLSVANAPMLDYVVSQLKYYGISDIVFTLGYKSQQIIEWVDGYKNITAHYQREDTPLGTCGGVKKAINFLDDCFIVVSGDALSNIDFSAMAERHRQSGADITMAVTTTQTPHLYGVVKHDKDGFVTAFNEKPLDAPKGSLISCGIYIINKYAMNLCPDNTKFDFARDLFPLVLERGSIAVYRHDGYWSDIGDVKSYYESNFHTLFGSFYPMAFNRYREEFSGYLAGGGRRSLISSSATVVGRIKNSIIGKRSHIASNAVVENCIIGDDVIVTGAHFGEIIGKDYCISVERYAGIKEDSPQFVNYF